MFLDQKDLKSKFLQKKNKEKKKTQQTQQQNQKVLTVQKCIRSFLMRKNLKNEVSSKGNPLNMLLMNQNISGIPYQHIINLTTELLRIQVLRKKTTSTSQIQIQSQQTFSTELFYLSRLFFATLEQSQQLLPIAFQILDSLKCNHPQMIRLIVRKQKFVQILKQSIHTKKFIKILNMTIHFMHEQRLMSKLNQHELFDLMINEYFQNKMQIQDDQKLDIKTINYLCLHFNQTSYQPLLRQFYLVYPSISSVLLSLVSLSTYQKIQAESINFLLSLIIELIQTQRSKLITKISSQYQNIYNFIQDEEDMKYFQNKITSHQYFQSFSNVVLPKIKQILENTIIIRLFSIPTQKSKTKLKETFLKLINLLSKSFEDRKIIFIRQLVSSDKILLSLLPQKSAQFYHGLKMKLLAMDDKQFAQLNLFSRSEWKQIIHTAVNKSYNIIRSQSQQTNQKLLKPIPFQSVNPSNLILLTLSQCIQNLYKKSLRTSKLQQSLFIHAQLGQLFLNFQFGSGALTIQRLLKLYPFCFTFESRLLKFKNLIKNDKLLHDRTLFLQEDIDPDLIITVRRGYEFLDAYMQCQPKDLRQKYKLVFFNEQGLEEQGIDGGGLIKQFINRVLKSAFSQVYGLFQQTTQHEIMPNPYSPSVEQYEFIGKLIGKAIYQNITIQQKFVQPFLNLLIGRKNAFQDIQYIDRQIYDSLVSIKNMASCQLQDLQQTFTILDHQPNGLNHYINLLSPNKQVKSNQASQLVNRDNKLQFVMAYSDFKCNKQLEDKTRYFRKGFFKVLKPQWLTLFNNQQLNRIISGGKPDFDVNQLKYNCVYVDYHEKSITIVHLWEILAQFTAEQKSQFLLYVTSCSRPPTLGFGSLKPKMCISKDENTLHLPTANTCMNVLRLPDYKNKQIMRQKLLYAINSKAGFEFA